MMRGAVSSSRKTTALSGARTAPRRRVVRITHLVSRTQRPAGRDVLLRVVETGGLDDEKRDGSGQGEDLGGLAGDAAHVGSPPLDAVVSRSRTMVNLNGPRVCRVRVATSVKLATLRSPAGRKSEEW